MTEPQAQETPEPVQNSAADEEMKRREAVASGEHTSEGAQQAPEAHQAAAPASKHAK
jgi:hypothetical protein